MRRGQQPNEKLENVQRVHVGRQYPCYKNVTPGIKNVRSMS